jgi:quinol monooxygenase YgiN
LLIIAGTVTFDPAHTEAVKAGATAMMAATMEEEGCQDYVFSINLSDEATIQVFEIWDTEEQLQAHFKMPHMDDFQQVLAGIGITGRDLTKYQVASSGPM